MNLTSVGARWGSCGLRGWTRSVVGSMMRGELRFAVHSAVIGAGRWGGVSTTGRWFAVKTAGRWTWRMVAGVLHITGMVENKRAGGH